MQILRAGAQGRAGAAAGVRLPGNRRSESRRRLPRLLRRRLPRQLLRAAARLCRSHGRVSSTRSLARIGGRRGGREGGRETSSLLGATPSPLLSPRLTPMAPSPSRETTELPAPHQRSGQNLDTRLPWPGNTRASIGAQNSPKETRWAPRQRLPALADPPTRAPGRHPGRTRTEGPQNACQERRQALPRSFRGVRNVTQGTPRLLA